MSVQVTGPSVVVPAHQVYESYLTLNGPSFPSGSEITVLSVTGPGILQQLQGYYYGAQYNAKIYLDGNVFTFSTTSVNGYWFPSSNTFFSSGSIAGTSQVPLHIHFASSLKITVTALSNYAGAVGYLGYVYEA